jgi:hypothetical protein
MLIKDIQDVEVRKLALIRQQAYQGKSNIEQLLLTAFLFSSTPEGGSFWRKVKNKKNNRIYFFNQIFVLILGMDKATRNNLIQFGIGLIITLTLIGALTGIILKFLNN